jgi:hypothetical protein
MALRVSRLAIVAAVVAPSLALAQDKPIDISLGTITGSNESGARFSLGSVGPDNRTTGSYVPERGADPYYFNIPSQRPFPGAPGITLHIPLQDDSGR